MRRQAKGTPTHPCSAPGPPSRVAIPVPPEAQAQVATKDRAVRAPGPGLLLLVAREERLVARVGTVIPAYSCYQ